LTGTYPFSIAVGDFNGDTYKDLVVANRDNNSLDVFLGYGNGNFIQQVALYTENTPTCVAVGDFNGDDRLDITVSNYENGVTYPADRGRGRRHGRRNKR
jgi:hypothetical protein